MITAPMTAYWMLSGIQSIRVMAFCRTCINAAPMITPITEPSPPRRLQPPRTAAAIAKSS